MTPAELTALKKVHPLRRKHRRGKRGGKKHRKSVDPLAVFLGAPLGDGERPVMGVLEPKAVASLRSRLSQLATNTANNSRKAG